MSTREERQWFAKGLRAWKAKEKVGFRRNADGKMWIIYLVAGRFVGVRV